MGNTSISKWIDDPTISSQKFRAISNKFALNCRQMLVRLFHPENCNGSVLQPAYINLEIVGKMPSGYCIYLGKNRIFTPLRIFKLVRKTKRVWAPDDETETITSLLDSSWLTYQLLGKRKATSRKPTACITRHVLTGSHQPKRVSW